MKAGQPLFLLPVFSFRKIPFHALQSGSIAEHDIRPVSYTHLDVYKRQVLQPAGVIIRKPFNVNHTSSELDELAKYIGSLEGETRVVLELSLIHI